MRTIKKEHQLWQVKCKMSIRQARKESEEQLPRDTKRNSKICFKYIRSRKLAKESVGLLDDGGAKRSLKEDKSLAEKLCEFSPLVFTAEGMGEIPGLSHSFQMAYLRNCLKLRCQEMRFDTQLINEAVRSQQEQVVFTQAV